MSAPVQELVSQFLRKLGHDLPAAPTAALLTEDVRRLWARIFLEEALELVEGMGIEVTLKGQKISSKKVRDGTLTFWADKPGLDLVELADGAADSDFVLKAVCSLAGIVEEPLAREVAENNLLKFAPGHTFVDGKLKKLAAAGYCPLYAASSCYTAFTAGTDVTPRDTTRMAGGFM